MAPIKGPKGPPEPGRTAEYRRSGKQKSFAEERGNPREGERWNMNIEKLENQQDQLRLLNLRVWQKGNMVLSKDWEEDIRRNIYSASKSFTSLAVGIAAREGLLSLDEKLCDAFPKELPEKAGEYLEQATVKDLLTMGLGQDAPYLMGGQRVCMEETDWVRFCLSRPFTHRPGEMFLYSNVGPYLAGVLVQRRCGCRLTDYLMPRLFEPLGIRPTVWEIDPAGYTFGAGGLFLSAGEMLKVGQLLLQNGCWEGRQLVPAEYLKQASQQQIDNGKFGYGFLFWMGDYGSWRADGKYGQTIVMLPRQQAVIVTTAESRDPQMEQKCLDVIVPQLM